MAHIVVRQADEKFAIWSTIVDGYVLLDASTDDVEDFFFEVSDAEARKAIDWHWARLRGEDGGYRHEPLFPPEVADRETGWNTHETEDD